MDEIIQAIKALLEADSTINSTYRSVFYSGKNIVPPLSSMPCLIVYPMGESMKNKGTASMINEFKVGIRVVDSVKRFLTENTDKETEGNVQSFVQRVGNRDSNGKPDSGTILRVLHDNRQLSSTAHIHEIQNVAYGSDEVTKDSLMIRADIEVVARRLSPR